MECGRYEVSISARMGLPIQLESPGREFHGVLPSSGSSFQDAAADHAGARYLERTGARSLHSLSSSGQRIDPGGMATIGSWRRLSVLVSFGFPTSRDQE